MMDAGWAEDVLSFWFQELTPRDWFAKSDELDARIRERFLALYETLATEDAVELHGPRELQAAVIVLDQFSRNLFRNNARAFAADPLARKLAARAIEQGLDAALPPEQRIFLYLPFEHSENRADQARAVALTSALGNENWTRYALAHQTLIERFGRFPHRNAVLGRESTPEEIEALSQPFGSF
jgi:uncharacterized protein (DUF924 family)